MTAQLAAHRDPITLCVPLDIMTWCLLSAKPPCYGSPAGRQRGTRSSPTHGRSRHVLLLVASCRVRVSISSKRPTTPKHAASTLVQHPDPPGTASLHPTPQTSAYSVGSALCAICAAAGNKCSVCARRTLSVGTKPKPFFLARHCVDLRCLRSCLRSQRGRPTTTRQSLTSDACCHPLRAHCRATAPMRQPCRDAASKRTPVSGCDKDDGLRGMAAELCSGLLETARGTEQRSGVRTRRRQEAAHARWL